jgi:hypothetical protein
MITFWVAVASHVPVASRPPPAATRAVTPTGRPGAGSGVSRQVRPPLTETAANGTGPDGRACVPSAVIRRPWMATRWSTALVAPAGCASSSDRHAWPLRDSHTAGSGPIAPTAA